MTPRFVAADPDLARLVVAADPEAPLDAHVSAWPSDALPAGRLVGLAVAGSDDLVTRGALVVGDTVMTGRAALDALWAAWISLGRGPADPVLVAATAHLLDPGRHAVVATADDVAGFTVPPELTHLIEPPASIEVGGCPGVAFWCRQRHTVTRLSAVWTGSEVVTRGESLADVAAGVVPRVELAHLVALARSDLDDPDTIPDEVADALIPDAGTTEPELAP